MFLLVAREDQHSISEVGRFPSILTNAPGNQELTSKKVASESNSDSVMVCPLPKKLLISRHAICMCIYIYVYVEFYVYHIYIYMYTHINVLMFTLDFKTLAIFECRNCTVRIIQPRPFKSKVFPRTCLFRTVWRAVFQLDLNSLQSFNGGAKYLFSKSRSCIRLNVSMKGLKGLSLKPTAIGVNPFN